MDGGASQLNLSTIVNKAHAAMASGVRDGLLSDGKSVEREFAAMLPGA